jgi:tetratricopeptide (TPR) repeat protein
MQIGVTLLKLERYDDSLEVFRKLRSMNEYDGEVWLGLGISLYSLGQAMEAGDALKNAMRFKPNQPALYYYLALAEQDDDAALRLLLRGYRIDSSNLDIIIELVNRLVKSGRKADAAAFLRKAKSIDPENPRIMALEEVCAKRT